MPGRWHWLRRPATLAGAAVLTVPTSVTAALVASRGQKALDTPHPSGPPVLIQSVVLRGDSETKGSSYAFPGPRIWMPQQLRSLDDAPDNCAWVRARGGVDTSAVIAQVVLAGNRARTIRILDITAAPRCASPLTGTLLHAPTAGEDSTVRLAFDLDQPHPQGRVAAGGIAEVGGTSPARPCR